MTRPVYEHDGPGWKYLMSNIPMLPEEEEMLKKKREKHRFKLLVLPAQTGTAWMKHILHKFTKPGNLFMDDCAETFLVNRLACFA